MQEDHVAETLHYNFNNNQANPGGMTITFVGPNAASLKAMFLDAYNRSSLFRAEVTAAAAQAKNVSIGSGAEMEAQPGYSNSNLTPDRIAGKAEVVSFSDLETYFVVVPGVAHTLQQLNPTLNYPGDTQMAMVHGFLHIPQYTNMFKPGGNPYSETNVQLKEQDIAVQLGREPGVDFPDIKGQPGDAPNSYQVVVPPNPPSTDAAAGVPTFKVDPISFEGQAGHPFNGSTQDFDLLKAGILNGTIAASGQIVDPQSGDRYTAASFDNNPNKIVISGDADGLTVGIVSAGLLHNIISYPVDGTRIDKIFDVAGVQNWFIHTDNYDVNGNRVSDQNDYRDNTHAISQYDPYAAQNWAWISTFYNANWAATWEAKGFDSGERRDTTFDFASSVP
jgi:hypothetical protein